MTLVRAVFCDADRESVKWCELSTGVCPCIVRSSSAMKVLLTESAPPFESYRSVGVFWIHRLKRVKNPKLLRVWRHGLIRESRATALTCPLFGDGNAVLGYHVSTLFKGEFPAQEAVRRADVGLGSVLGSSGPGA